MNIRLFTASCFLFVITIISMNAKANMIVEDFENGVTFPPSFNYSGNGASIAVIYEQLLASDPNALPGQVGVNTVAKINVDSAVGFAGIGQFFGTTQDWSRYQGIKFLMNSFSLDPTFQFEIFDNSSDPNNDQAERFDVTISNAQSGWQEITIMFPTFMRAVDFQPVDAPDDGFGLTEINGWALVLDGNVGEIYFDNLMLIPEPKTILLFFIGLLFIFKREKLLQQGD